MSWKRKMGNLSSGRNWVDQFLGFFFGFLQVVKNKSRGRWNYYYVDEIILSCEMILSYDFPWLKEGLNEGITL